MPEPSNAVTDENKGGATRFGETGQKRSDRPSPIPNALKIYWRFGLLVSKSVRINQTRLSNVKKY
ncbi:hypothetical protein COO91_03590 [Nostoc flagelliforme CCNUN1]|uniref:Uncharacterized protein n=1 Tax=Nostoc flagelliforme CCNUN1 TaxID=2038116 RepID=A0A2K8SQ94_9NOSO|nr:hypothetical protein COO91_03590 [Nostoc flagelliforme CCNUN1]